MREAACAVLCGTQIYDYTGFRSTWGSEKFKKLTRRSTMTAKYYTPGQLLNANLSGASSIANHIAQSITFSYNFKIPAIFR
jgi:hypothetical protein